MTKHTISGPRVRPSPLRAAWSSSTGLLYMHRSRPWFQTIGEMTAIGRAPDLSAARITSLRYGCVSLAAFKGSNSEHLGDCIHFEPL